MNVITLVGRLTRDPSYSEVQNEGLSGNSSFGPSSWIMYLWWSTPSALWNISLNILPALLPK
ncbi:MAG: single-stranded DNA-binding protein [Lachnospiraceae bacterium]|nr:single-stranded DNA-binding protein [Lachnospiraceae bacterium]